MGYNPEKSVLFYLHPVFIHWRHRLCVLNGWDRFDEDLLQTPCAAPSQGPNISSADYSLLKPATCRWKKIYMRALFLDKNWAQGRYSVAPLLRGHKEPITCMDCNGKHHYKKIFKFHYCKYSFPHKMWKFCILFKIIIIVRGFLMLWFWQQILFTYWWLKFCFQYFSFHELFILTLIWAETRWCLVPFLIKSSLLVLPQVAPLYLAHLIILCVYGMLKQTKFFLCWVLHIQTLCGACNSRYDKW